MTNLKTIIFILLFSFVLLIKSVTSAVDCWGWEASTQEQCDFGKKWAVAVWTQKCKWIKLNTNFPFIWDCIQTFDYSGTNEDWTSKTTPINAFPKLMWALMNLLMTVILIMSLLMIVYSWVLMTTWWYSTSNYTKGIWLLSQVAKWMALLWASWVILKVINPNFFV